MDKLVKDLPAEGKILWSIGTPTKYGNYLVLCNTSKGQRINHDVWFDDGRGWQSKWQNMVAWCCLDDINLYETTNPRHYPSRKVRHTSLPFLYKVETGSGATSCFE